MRYSCIIVLLVLLFGCNNNGIQAGKEQQAAVVQKPGPTGAFDVEPFFASVDSLQVLYFDDPYGDSIRYTRYYSYVNSNDSNFLSALQQQLKQPFNIRTSADTCRSDGKIFLLVKGEPVKTLYFSSRCPGCCYTYFIKDGNFYYMPLLSNFSKAIQGGKKLAQRP